MSDNRDRVAVLRDDLAEWFTTLESVAVRSDGQSATDALVMSGEVAYYRQQPAVAHPPADLPATLASVDDVAAVARAAGFVQANEDPDYWKDEHDVLLDITGEYGDDDVGLDEVCVQRSDDSDVATVHCGAPGALLWHAIQAARSAS